MNIHTNKKLFDLATRNSQRLAFDTSIRDHHEQITNWLSTCEKIYHPETPDAFKQVISKSHRCHDSENHNESVIVTLKTSSLENANSHIQKWLLHLPLGKYYLLLGGGNGVTFDNQTEWISKLPVLVTTLFEIRSHLETLLNFSAGELVLATIDGSSAIVSESFGGYLPDEPSDHEIVYELTSWTENY